ncbi:YceI family protein [Luminiphilus sp.]|nr:YceI family protein [Luminiphilus sp.]MDB2557254.1 YceI family protein [Luminiphilus sp.]
MSRLFFVQAATLLITLVMTGSAHAGWDVTASSRVGFVSIKNNRIGENNVFEQVTGSISDAGHVAVSIDLTSVETGVGIRNERLQRMLFEVAKFPTARVQATLSASQLDALKTGSSVSETVKVTVSLHGVSVDKLAALSVSVSEDGLRVTSTQPIVVTAQDFGLESGVAALQAIAGLNAISRSIPITVDLSLRTN